MAHKAIDWLIRALGFEKRMVHEADGLVMHAELNFGNGMIMLGSVKEADWARLIAQPDEIADRTSNTICLIATDATALYQTAKAAGAEIVWELAEMPYGGKMFGCKDPEGAPVVDWRV